jgi:acetylglutamate kinase
MSERLAIELPDDLSNAQQEELVASLRQIDEVEGAENLGPSRSVDLETISIGVQLATQIGVLIGPVVKTIIGTIRRHQIKGVSVSLPDGTSVVVDEISPKDLDHLIDRLGK